MDLNLDKLRGEITQYLQSSGLHVFHGTPVPVESMPSAVWDTERYPDYQMFLEVAKNAGAKVIMLSWREFDEGEIELAKEELEEAELSKEERRDYERKLRDFRSFAGATCDLLLAFQLDARLYVYQLRPDWYDEFGDITDEISMSVPSDDEDDDGLDGYFSKN